MKCLNCLFCTDYETRDDAGFCRRYPPIYVIDDNGDTILTRPVVSADEWCGEFRVKRND